MADVCGHVNAVHNHIGGAQEVRQWLFLNAVKAGLEL